MAKKKLNQKDLNIVLELKKPAYKAKKYNSGGVDTVKIWCPFCLRDHEHGNPENKPFVLSSRSAHCYDHANHPNGYFFFTEN